MTLCVIHPKQTGKKSLETLSVATKKVGLAVGTENTECIFTSLEDKGEKITTKREISYFKYQCLMKII
jgi:hypothetical protein